MPGLDHEVHELVRRDESHRYGCHNRPRFRERLTVKNGFTADGHQKFTLIDDFGSLECRYDGKGGLTADDPRCAGCEHYKQSDYVQSILQNGT